MRILLAVLSTCALLAVGCGPDSELVASGKIHKCKIQELAKKLQAEPGNTELLKQLETTTGDLKAVIETAEEGKRAELQKTIDEAVARGCD